jgi:amino acid transporter
MKSAVNYFFRLLNLTISFYLTYIVFSNVAYTLEAKNVFSFAPLINIVILFGLVSILFIYNLIVIIDTFKIPTDWSKGNREFLGKVIHFPILAFLLISSSTISMSGYFYTIQDYIGLILLSVVFLYSIIHKDWKRVQKELKA